MTFESKFRNFVGRIEKLSREEITVLSRSLLNEFNQEKADIWKVVYIEPNYKPNENWDEIELHKKRSNIKRYSWRNIIGTTITTRILKLREKGLTAEESIDAIERLPGVMDFVAKYPEEDSNMAKNIKINVHARYGENKTSEKIKEKNEN